MSAGIIIILLLALVLVIFTLQNSVAIDVDFLFWQIDQVPLVLTLLISVIIGFLIAMVVYYPKIWRINSKVKALQKELKTWQSGQQVTIKHPEGIKIDGDADTTLFND